MEGEFSPKLISSLNPYELKLYAQVKREIREGVTLTYDQSVNLDYAHRPPNIKQFIEDDYYLGGTLAPTEFNEGIWPTWKEILIRDFSLQSRIHNLVITGSLGMGKTWMMVVIILYRMALSTMLKNPQHFFGISRGSRIIYNFLSVTKMAVRDTAFGDAMNFMAVSPYFLEVCKYDPELEYSGFRIPMLNSLPDGRPSEIFLTAGSKGQHVLGQNVIGVGLDEGNFRLEKDPDLKAYALYNQVRTRISNRFQKVVGFLPAISVIASSAADESSFTEQVIKEIEDQRDPITQTVYRNSVYKIKRHALTLSDVWFRVAYGLKNMEPFILSGWYREDGTKSEVGPNGEVGSHHEEPPQGARTELVPSDYWAEYRRNCRVALQNQSGISTGGSYRLFSSMIDVEHCITASERDGLVNPAKIEMFPISMEDDQNIWDFLDHKTFLTRVSSRVLPKRHPNNKRYAHLDLATQSMAGVAICHLVGNQLVDGLVRAGQPFSEYRLVVEYDFILTITAGNTKPISLEKIQKFFFWLRDMCGYTFGNITADQFQSTQQLQMLEARGFVTDRLSIDRDKTAYTAWRMGFEEHRIRLYRQAQMLREAENLMEEDKKFDHPPNGSKDTTDAAAGAYFNAVSSDEKISLSSFNAAGVFTGQHADQPDAPPPPVAIVLPAKGYDRSKVFEA